MEHPGVRLLVADVDASVRGIIRLSAAEEHWSCDDVADGITALKRIKTEAYDLMVLDADLPQIDGLIVCRHLRRTLQTPVILLGTSASEQNRLDAFSAGGNDFLQKPFYPRELMARIKNLLTLCGCSMPHEMLGMGKLTIDVNAHAVWMQGQNVFLSPKEYELLLFFCKNQGQAFSRNALLDLVWGRDFVGSDRTVDTHVKNLRQKLDACQEYFITVWGYGYKFQMGSGEDR